jgi:hypothetical protein
VQQPAGHEPGGERDQRQGQQGQAQADLFGEVDVRGGEVEEDRRRQQEVEDRQQRPARGGRGGARPAPLGADADRGRDDDRGRGEDDVDGVAFALRAGSVG